MDDLSFFSKTEKEIIRGDESSNKKLDCETCKLYKGCNTPKMKYSGKGNLKILIIGEAPGKTEDETGIQFIGSSGQLLREIIEELGLDLDEDFWKINAVSCRPPKNRTPSPLEVSCCRSILLDTIKKLQPKVIIPLGKIAMEGLVGYRLTGRLRNISITDWAGENIPDQELNCYICPSWHPSYLIRQGEDIILKKLLKNHVKKAVELSRNESWYSYNYNSDCFITTDLEEAKGYLKKLSKKKILTFDFETTGKKPYKIGHEIYTVSLSDGLFSFAFPFFDNEEFRWLFKDIMVNPKIKKIAHNAKFEMLWYKVRGAFNNKESEWPVNVYWDTMLGAHIFHNQKKTNLKYLTYVKLGIAGYDEDIDKFLVSLDDKEFGANSFNRIKEAPIGKLLFYNALDSLFTYKLYEYQKSNLSEEEIQALFFHMESTASLAKMEYNGINFNEEEAKEISDRISGKMNSIEKTILSLPEMKKWDKDYTFRPSATGDITYLLFDKLKYKVGEKYLTPTGKPKGDIESLERFDIPLVKKVLEWRKWQKVSSTYLDGLKRESYNNLIHCFFNLGLVDSFRTSSDSPNLQNIPHRDGDVAFLVRQLFFPSLGNILNEYDYKAVEVCIIACYNKDPNLIKYIKDPSSDLHKDMAALIFMKDRNEVTSQERYLAKNRFVFPTFYGSYWKNTSRNLWEGALPETIKHLKDKGIKNNLNFTAHVEDVEEEFWGKFSTAYEWMNRVIKDYERKGYIEMYTGFKCYAPLTRNQLINYRVQGTACHCLLWTLNNVTKEMERKKLESKLVLQIHDSILSDTKKEEEDIIDYLIVKYGTQKIREYWEWLIVPLSIEKKRGTESWAEMEDCKL